MTTPQTTPHPAAAEFLPKLWTVLREGYGAKDLRADADALKKEEQSLAQRRKTVENKAKSLKDWLFMALEGDKFKTPRCAVSYRHSRAVEVPDIRKLAPDYIDYTPKPKKKDIKHMLESGFPVEGAQLVDRLSVIIK